MCSPVGEEFKEHSSRYILMQSQQRKQQNNVWNLFKVNLKDLIDDVFIVNVGQISRIILVFPLLTLNK